MVDFAGIEEAVVTGLGYWLNAGALPPANTAPVEWPAVKKGRPVTLVRANVTSPAPAFPYLAYTVTAPAGQKGGTYGVLPEDGRFFGPAEMLWSLTVNSDDDDEALALAFAARDWFVAAGLVWLCDHGVAVGRLHRMTARDSLLSARYCYRKGFDVALWTTDVVEATEAGRAGVIEAVGEG